jgi:hypothetical protein
MVTSSRGNWGVRSSESEPTVTPSACPFCQSTAVSAPPKSDASTYWRCGTCGEMWNAARLIQRNVHRDRRGW